MGKGDKKTARGKRVAGSYGNTRRRKSVKTSIGVDSSVDTTGEKPVKKAAKATKKTSTKKSEE